MFAVQVSKWVFDWLGGNVRGYMPAHVKRYIPNMAKVPHTHFSMLNEIYLNLVAPLEDFGLIMPNKMLPDASTGRMFSDFLRQQGIDPDSFPTYQHDFDDGRCPVVEARLYPIKYLPKFREYFKGLIQNCTYYFGVLLRCFVGVKTIRASSSGVMSIGGMMFLGGRPAFLFILRSYDGLNIAFIIRPSHIAINQRQEHILII